jgi:2-oxoglutarate dehydrogenase complex dehydrogenase (E1) component-like enzyme
VCSFPCGRYRRALVLFTSKRLLRDPAATSSLDRFGPDSHFEPVLASPPPPPPLGLRRTVICSGEIYHDLLAHGMYRPDRVWLIRLEQLAPFPKDALRTVLAGRQSVAADTVFVQEEPRNQGAWSFVADQLHAMGIHPRYLGPPSMAVSAVEPAHWPAQRAALLQEALAI